MPASDYMLTAGELRLRQRKRRRLVLLLALVLVLGLLVFFAGRPVRDAIKGWQARRHAEKAFAFIEQSNWKEARSEAVAAYQLRFDEPAALRAVARMLSRMRQPDALEFWRRLEENEPLTRTDRRDQAAVALASGETAVAETAVHSLLNDKSSPPTPGDWLLVAQLALGKSSAADAQSALDKIFADPHTTEPEQLQAVLLQFALLRADDSDKRAARQEAATVRLKKLAAGKSSTALDALTLLARQTLSRAEGATDAPLMTTPDLVAALEQHPLAKAQHKLLALDLQIRGDAAQREPLIARGIAEWKEAEPADVAVLAEWLNGKGEFQRQLDTVPLERALANRDLFLQHLDALGALGRWDEIKHLLEGERFPLDQVVAAMYLARCNAQLGEKTASENNWQRALEAARGDIGKVTSLAAYAEKNGAVEVAAAAYDEAALQAPKLRAAQQGRLRIAQGRSDTKRIHAVLAEMLGLWPNDSAVQNDEAYTRLLLMQPRNADFGMRNAEGSKAEASDPKSAPLAANNQEPITNNGGKRPTPNAQRPTPNEDVGGTGSVPSGTNSEHPTPNPQLPSSNPELLAPSELAAIEAIAAKLVEREPASLPHRTLLALARLQQNRAADALAVYEKLQMTPQALTPSALAVHAAVLAANGNRADAKTEAAQVPADKLLPEERALIADLL